MSVYTFNLDGFIVPKARARTTANGTFMPHKYNDWKQGAIADISSQYRGEPLEHAEVTISLTGKHNRQGDADNVAGAVLDALVQARVLVDDNLKRVPSLTICLDWQKKAEPKAVVVLSTAQTEMDYSGNPCEWNPDEGRAAYENEVHSFATVSLGNGKWHLCESCAALPEFKRFRKRVPIGGGKTA